MQYIRENKEKKNKCYPIYEYVFNKGQYTKLMITELPRLRTNWEPINDDLIKREMNWEIIIGTNWARNECRGSRWKKLINFISYQIVYPSKFSSMILKTWIDIIHFKELRLNLRGNYLEGEALFSLSLSHRDRPTKSVFRVCSSFRRHPQLVKMKFPQAIRLYLGNWIQGFVEYSHF
jgi:hypothetical protein